MPSPTAAVLLAAGAGTRFGGTTHKLRATIGGRSLLALTVDAMAASGLPLLAVVTGALAVDEAMPGGVEVIVNPLWEQGQATSLAAGLRWAAGHGCGAAVVGLADQPGVTAAAWRSVAGAEDAAIAVATYDGRRGHPVRLRRDIWDRLPVTGDAGARVLMAEEPGLVFEVPCDGSPLDVDTQEDLARWR